MFKEFNVKFEDAEIIGGADNLLEGTGVTKVILRGDNKLSSLDSTFKNCSQLDTIDGGLNLDGISDVDSLLEGTNLVTSIDLKNVNNKDITANNAFSHVNQINIGGETYNKEAIQNIISSREWTFNNINYIDTVGEDVVTHTSNITEENENTQIVINDALEQKARDIEIKGQTYQNLIQGKEGAELLADIKFESIDGSPSELEPPIDHPVCVETIEGETYQNLIHGKGEYNLTDTYNATWNESNSSFEDIPDVIEIPEIFGNTIQGYANVVSAQQIVNAINGSLTNGESWLHSNNNETFTVKYAGPSVTPTSSDNFIQLKANTTYTVRCYRFNSTQNPIIYYYLGNNYSVGIRTNGGSTFTTDSSGKVLFYPESAQSGQLYLRVVEGSVNLNSYNYNEYDLNYIQSVGDLYVDEEGNPILDEEGNEQYKLEVISRGKNLCPQSFNILSDGSQDYMVFTENIFVKPNTKYYIKDNLNLRYQWYEHDKFGNRTDAKYPFGYGASITTSSNTSYVQLRTYSGYADESVKVQIEEGDSPTDFQPYFESKTTILMPQPLRKVGKYSDKLYWDYNSKRYFIENNVKEVFGTKGQFLPTGDYLNADPVSFYNYTTYLDGDLKNNAGGIITNLRGCTSMNASSSINIYIRREVLGLDNTNTENEYKARLSQLMNEQGVRYIFRLVTPKIIETKIVEKLSLEAYSPKTHISTNTEIQPSQMTLTNKRNVFVPLGLQANKDYTLQLDSVGKDDKPITVNLGGSEITTQPVNDTSTHHKVVIKTPSTLTTDKLELSGEGVVVNDVMLFEGGEDVIKQEVEYVEGIQSIGEPMYQIDIRTSNNYEKLWREL